MPGLIPWALHVSRDVQPYTLRLGLSPEAAAAIGAPEALSIEWDCHPRARAGGLIVSDPEAPGAAPAGRPAWTPGRGADRGRLVCTVLTLGTPLADLRCGWYDGLPLGPGRLAILTDKAPAARRDKKRRAA